MVASNKARRGGIRRFVRALSMAGLLTIGGMTAAGCEPPDWTDTQFLSEQVEKGDRLKALEEIPRLSKEDQAKVVPALINAYNNGQDKEKCFEILAAQRDKRAMSVYVDALKNAKSNRDKAKAAVALGDLKATEHIPAMVEMFRNVPNQDLRRAILEAFVAMPDGAQVPLLVDILKNFDPDREPIAYHAYACDVLGDIGQATDTVSQAVVYGLYLDNAKNQNVLKECSVAVAAVGPKATDALVQVMKGENQDIKRRFAKYATYVEGSAEVTAVDTISLINGKTAVPAILEEMTKKKDPPATYRDQKLLSWGQKRTEFFVAGCGSVGDLGDPAALETLKNYVVYDAKVFEPYKDLIDYDKRTALFMIEAVYKAINAIGDRKGLEHLAKGATKGDLPMLKAYGDDGVVQTRWGAARAYAMLATGAELEAYDKMAKGEKNATMKKKWAEFRPAVEVAKECGQDAACYGKHLLGKDAIKAEKAAWELGRMAKGGAAEAELIKALDTANVDLRFKVIKSLYRVGTAAGAGAKVTEVLEKESGKATPEYKLLHVKMKALRSHVKRQG